MAKNRALEGARRKGMEAAKSGATMFACPYKDFGQGNRSGQATFASAFRNAWIAGWISWHQGKDVGK